MSEIEEFEKLFVHKGEDNDQNPQDWGWTIRGSFPIEVEQFIKTIISTKKEELDRLKEINRELVKTLEWIIKVDHIDNEGINKIIIKAKEEVKDE